MSLFLIHFFHDCSLSDQCFDKKVCVDLHKSFFNKRKIFPRLLFCLPILGQIGGILVIIEGCRLVKSEYYYEKVNSFYLIVRGLITFLGLGIICLLIDVIVTLVIFIKNKISFFKRLN